MLIKSKASLVAKTIAVALPMLFAAQAQAADGGTIAFSGNVTANTCNVSVSNTALTNSNTATITLPSINATSLSTSGAFGATTQFTIGVAGCTGGNNAFVTTFSPAAADVSNTGKLINKATSGAASNVVLEILSSANTAVDLSKATATLQQGLTTATSSITNGTGSQIYKVQYLATGAATAGAVSASLPFTLTYQ